MTGGKAWTAEALFEKVYRYKTYWRDNGGITVSGGEALLQMEFVTEFFQIAKKNHVHTALDTSGEPFRMDAEYLERGPVYFFGNGADKCKGKLTHPNAHFIDNIHPLASMMFPLAEKAMAQGRFEDVAYFEPFYLKEFVAGKPKKLV